MIPIPKQHVTSRSHSINGLYAITPELENTTELLDKTQQALKGGARLVQYRSKSINRQTLKRQAIRLLQLCKHYQALLIINDHLDLACDINADGVHLGRDDGTITAARQRLGNDKIIGASCYNELNLALRAAEEGADYVAFGALFPSITKLNTVPVSTDFIHHVRKHIAIPIVGIGGIQLQNAKSVIQSGYDCVAVCHDLFAAGIDTQSQAMKFTQLFQ